MAQELGPLSTVIVTLGSAVVTSAGLGVWIMKQFDNQRKDFYKALSEQRVTLEEKIDSHESIDQKRHEDNLGEFKGISNTLTRLEYTGNLGRGNRH